MKVSLKITFTILAALFCGAWTRGNYIAPPINRLFGVDVLSTGQAMPPLVGTAVRMWDTGATWKDLNPSNGVYAFASTGFDAQVASAAANGEDLIYTIAETPAWASSNPTDATCLWGLGACDPPSNYTYLTTFLTAIVAESAGRVKYWECWNEPANANEWAGSVAQLVTFCNHVYSTLKGIDPTLIVLTPSLNYVAGTWAQSYLAAGGGAYADVANVHAYPLGSAPVEAEQALQFGSQFSSLAESYMLSTTPLWDTESSWADNPNLSSNATLEAAYVAKMYLLASPSGFARRYFYGYSINSSTFANLWNNPNLTPTPYGLTGAGVAYQQVEKWMTGATVVSPVQRHANTNVDTNTTLSGCLPGTPGTLPTGWLLSTAAGIADTIVDCGSDASGHYLDYRFNGTYSGGSLISTGLSLGAQDPTSANHQWTLSWNTMLTGGSIANISTIETTVDFFNSGFGYVGGSGYNFTPNSVLQATTVWGVAPATTLYTYPLFSLQLGPGAVIDITERLYAPTLDDGTQWLGTFTRPGGYQAEAVWDQNPTGGATITAPAWATQYHDVTGGVTAVTGGVTGVTLTRSPILFENQSAF